MGPETECFDLEEYLEEIKQIAEEHERIGNAFAEKMIEQMQELDPEFSETVDKHLWELI